MKPFVEVEGDTRVHDLQFDRSGYQRDSSGGYAKAGTSFEFTRLLTGELSIGYAARNYVDPRLNRLAGLSHHGLAGVVGDAADHGEIHLDTQIAETTLRRRLRRAGAHLHGRGRPRFPPLADRHRQVHLRHARLPGLWPQRQNLFAGRRLDLQDDAQSSGSRAACATTCWSPICPARARRRRW